MFRYLNAIAVADGHVDPKEQVLLDQLAATLGLSIGRRAQAV
jgi:tellurite resistance protein